MKAKRKPQPKAERASLDKRITAAATPQDKMRLALFGRDKPLNRVEELAESWRRVHAMRDAASRNDRTTAILRRAWQDAKQAASDFIRDAMWGWNPEMLASLAREMKRVAREKPWKADGIAFDLLQASEAGAVNLSAIARKSVEDEFATKQPTLSAIEIKRQKDERFEAKLRTLRRKAHRLTLKTRDPGRPKK